MKKYLIFSLLLGLAFTVNAQSTGIQFFTGTFEEAKVKAAEDNKLIFVDAYTVWCGPCKWMSKNIFTQPEVADFFNEHFINLKLDMERGEGTTFARTYRIYAYPTLLFVDGEGAVTLRTKGAKQTDTLIALGKQAVTEAKVKKKMYLDQNNEGRTEK